MTSRLIGAVLFVLSQYPFGSKCKQLFDTSQSTPDKWPIANVKSRWVYDSRDRQNLSAERLVSLTRSPTPKDFGLEVQAPMFFFQGTEDFTSLTALAKQYLGAMIAPLKEFVPIDGGHFVVFMRSDQFLEELFARVRPLAIGQ